jgi:hypothetical protein
MNEYLKWLLEDYVDAYSGEFEYDRLQSEIGSQEDERPDI